MIIFISQCYRTLNRQEYVDEITQVEQRRKLENGSLEELYILAKQQDTGQGNDQKITKVKEMKELVEEWIPLPPTEEKSGKFAEDPDIQIHKKAVKELRHDNRVDQPGLIVK